MMNASMGCLKAPEPVVSLRTRWFFLLGIVGMVGALAFAVGMAWGLQAHADEVKRDPRIQYPKKTDLDFEGLAIEGEVKNPGEFYFQHRNEEKFDSLVQRRKNFHREMLRDAVLSN